MGLNIQKIKNRTEFHCTKNGYYLLGYPKNYDVNNAPHENTLKSAQDYCKKNMFGGVTFQYNRYEVREGRYLRFDERDVDVMSWVYC